ncbi:hypothetical protein GDO86_012219 [Hymenochirus boettgeri]|uniref:Anti-proliferative protein domain-containing protein n=1 Tax=Hymenochirus boettgeri TaxID=247094 RepID=A0A8T2IP75_9PIPI|nr:hypothetical protein GDO86_012219 [Hymenochirus boettgeri]
MSVTVLLEMRDEILAAVGYLKSLVNRYHQLDPIKLETFGSRLEEVLCRRYTGHWYPENPTKGQAYRLREENHPYTVAAFDPKRNRRTSKVMENPSPANCSFDSACSSPRSTVFSSAGEDLDSGIDSSSEDLSQALYDQTRKDQAWTPLRTFQTPTSKPFYRNSTPLWIPTWRATEYFYNVISSPEQTYWM